MAIRMGYDDAIKWAEAVAAGKVDPQSIADATPGAGKGIAEAWSDDERGW